MGGTLIEGPSIRFVEQALRCYRNVSTEVTTVYDDDRLRICRVVVLDLEANDGFASEVQVSKTVERRGFAGRDGNSEPPKGRQVLGERVNTSGDTLYIVAATDDEVITKQNALISKAVRTLGLRLLPGDIVEEAQAVIIATVKKEIIDDPVAAKRKLIDSFAEFSVLPGDLEAWAGKPIDRLQPTEIAQLRKLWAAIRDGEATWEAVMEEKNPSGSIEAAQEVAQRKIAALRGGAATKQSGSTPEAASTVSGGQEAGDSPKGSGEQSGKSQPEEPSFLTDEQALRLVSQAQELGWQPKELRSMLQRMGIHSEAEIPVDRLDDVLEAINGGAEQPKEDPAPKGKTRRLL